MRERWKTIPRFRRYKVSNRGRVRGINGKILKPALNGAGYLFVALLNSRRRELHQIHSLVAKAFVPGYKAKLEVNHKSGNKRRNVWKNLEWVTRSKNQFHAYANGLNTSGEDSHMCLKLNSKTVKAIRAIGNLISQKAIAIAFGISQSHVSFILNKKKWRQLK